MADAGDENFTPLDVTTLTQQQAHDYRQELIQALLNPGIEFDLVGGEGERDEKLYAAQLKAVDDHLNTFPGAPLGGPPGDDFRS
jgi:hypothetical protein